MTFEHRKAEHAPYSQLLQVAGEYNWRYPELDEGKALALKHWTRLGEYRFQLISEVHTQSRGTGRYYHPATGRFLSEDPIRQEAR